jgi:CDP-diglyceride synthetase
MDTYRRQLVVFVLLLATNALLASLTYALGPADQFYTGQEMPPEAATTPPWLVGLANAGIILVFYGLLGLLGLWFARRLGWPGALRPGAGWRSWFWWPMALGLVAGVVLVVGDRFFSALGESGGFPHPAFPMSLIASATAGIGEEIIFRVFVMGLWAFLLHFILPRNEGLVIRSKP